MRNTNSSVAFHITKAVLHAGMKDKRIDFTTAIETVREMGFSHVSQMPDSRFLELLVRLKLVYPDPLVTIATSLATGAHPANVIEVQRDYMRVDAGTGREKPLEDSDWPNN